MTTKEAKAIDIVNYLAGRGFQPQKISVINYWYLSPLRSEENPSFKVNRKLNCWYDFGLGCGANLIDLILRLDVCTVAQALQKLSDKPFTTANQSSIQKKTASIEILSTSLISSFALLRYLEERRIHAVIADTFLKEVRYRNGDKIFYALGFKNDAGGYELRSSNFKGSSSPKSVSLIRNNSHSLAVFEGFFDFLSYATITYFNPSPTRDFLILNSTAFFEQQLSLMQSYQQVHLYLDNDTTGNKFTTMAIASDAEKFIDERSLYKSSKDLNEWLVYIGKTVSPPR